MKTSATGTELRLGIVMDHHSRAMWRTCDMVFNPRLGRFNPISSGYI